MYWDSRASAAPTELRPDRSAIWLPIAARTDALSPHALPPTSATATLIRSLKGAFAMSRSSDPKKIVLAYSGGLDTSVILPWLKDRYPGVKLVAFAATT